MIRQKLLILIVTVFLGVLFYVIFKDYIDLENFQDNKFVIESLYEDNKIETLFIYSAIYIVSAALSLPFASLLTLLAGALFYFPIAILVVAVSSSVGALIATIISRYILKDWVTSMTNKEVGKVKNAFEKRGLEYLLFLRIIPIIPFFLINLVMGATNIRLFSYFVVTFFGVIPGTVIYILAGREIWKLESIASIFSSKILILLVIVIGAQFFLVKFIKFKEKKKLSNRNKC